MSFQSDNTAPVAPEVMDALVRINRDMAPAYGGDMATSRLNKAFTDLFETPVSVLPVSLGTAANGLLLSLYTPPWGAVFAHEASHIIEDESTAPELYTGGARLVGLPGARAKLSAETLDTHLSAWPHGFVHAAKPAVLALTQATEQGTVYTPGEIAALTSVARSHGLGTVMDGARFANAVAALDCAPADIAWRAGVDALVFGATKNGGLGAEAMVLFAPDKAGELAHRRKRAGHLMSKMRYLSAQLLAAVEDDAWLRRAHHANAMAARLAQGLADLPGVSLCHPCEANAVFVRLPAPMAEALWERGFGFHPWRGLGRDAYRLVTAWSTDMQEVDAFLEAARHAAAC